MTVIAWDGKTLAADKLANFGGLGRAVTKIHRVGDLLVAASGTTWAAAEALAWVERGRKPEDFPPGLRDKDDWVPILVIENRQCLLYERSPYPTEIEDGVFAMGNGRDFALAAMRMGADARRAVEVACYFCPDCGIGVDSIEAPVDRVH